MAEQKLTDLSYLQSISMGDDSLVAEMIDLFLENAPVSIKSLRTFIHQQDWPRVAAAAHKFKPNLSYMGLESARKILEQLEENARKERELGNLGDQVTQIEQVCEQSYKELNKALGELRS